jgi:hypothetical protein
MQDCAVEQDQEGQRFTRFRVHRRGKPFKEADGRVVDRSREVDQITTERLLEESLGPIEDGSQDVRIRTNTAYMGLSLLGCCAVPTKPKRSSRSAAVQRRQHDITEVERRSNRHRPTRRAGPNGFTFRSDRRSCGDAE